MGSRLHFTDKPLPGVEVRTSTVGDCLSLGPRLRKEDCQEIEAVAGCKPTEGLLYSYFNSKGCLTVTLKGVPIIMFGCGAFPDNDRIGMIWLLSSPELLEVSKPFLRHSRRFLALLTAPYDLVMNYVDCRNEVHHRWLRWCGFVFLTKHEQFGVGKMPFYEVVRV